MKRIIAIALFISLGLQVNAQLLWKVTGNNISQPSYIMGTHHMAPLSILDEIPGLHKAFDSTTHVVGEIITSQMQSPGTMQLMQRMMTIENDTTLKTLLSEQDYQTVHAFVSENMGFDLGMMPKLKPAFIMNNAVVLIYMKHLPGFNPQELLDAYFQTKGAADGKKISALETIEFQLDMLYNKASLQRQAVQLMCLLNNTKKTVESSRKLTESYLKQDIEALLTLSLEREGTECDPIPGELERMIDDRNRNWVVQLPEILKEPTFVVVGALHLPGENGILELLRKQGYKVEPVQ